MDQPQRIVSLISSATEILFAIGAGDKLVAVSHECDYPAAARQLPKATRSLIDSKLASSAIDELVAARSSEGAALYELDESLIRQLRPDFIITQAQCDVCAVRYTDVVALVAAEQALAQAKVLALNPSCLEDVLADVLRVGEMAGLPTHANRFVDSLRARIKTVSDQTDPLATLDRPRVACIEWVDPLMLAGNWTPQLLSLAGGSTDMSLAGNHSTYSRWEDLIRFDPQVLFISPCGFDLARSMQEAMALHDKPGWNELSAVKNGRTWVIDGNAYLNRSGPRLVDSLEILAHLTHPTLFDRPVWSDPNALPWAPVPN